MCAPRRGTQSNEPKFMVYSEPRSIDVIVILALTLSAISVKCLGYVIILILLGLSFLLVVRSFGKIDLWLP